MKPINLILFGLLLSTQYALWFGNQNTFDMYQQRSATTLQEQENHTLTQRNQLLVGQVIDLKNGGETIETIARSNLGLIKEAETFYQIIE